ncbi:MAG: hypothetical protein HYY37_04555 [Candidatus Aenigmarchaeota archaeon]|nr:hypothetical protein [Candidatus Aenigmarchaeota archaeon]
MVLEVMEYAARIIRRYPKVVLPQVLAWIPTALFSLLFASGMAAFAKHFTMRSFTEALSNMQATLNAVMPYLAAFAALMVFAVLVNTFINAAYPPLVQQAIRRKPVMLSAAFGTARERFLSLLWAYFLLITLVLVACVPLVLLMLAGPLGVITAVIGIVALVFVAVLGSWQLEPVVVIERQGGIQALRRSFGIARHAFWQALGVIALVVVIIMVVAAAFEAIPQVGYLLSLVAALFTSALAAITKTVFYYRHAKKKRL